MELIHSLLVFALCPRVLVLVSVCALLARKIATALAMVWKCQRTFASSPVCLLSAQRARLSGGRQRSFARAQSTREGWTGSEQARAGHKRPAREREARKHACAASRLERCEHNARQTALGGERASSHPHGPAGACFPPAPLCGKTRARKQVEASAPVCVSVHVCKSLRNARLGQRRTIALGPPDLQRNGCFVRSSREM